MLTFSWGRIGPNPCLRCASPRLRRICTRETWEAPWICQGADKPLPSAEAPPVFGSCRPRTGDHSIYTKKPPGLQETERLCSRFVRLTRGALDGEGLWQSVTVFATCLKRGAARPWPLRRSLASDPPKAPAPLVFPSHRHAAHTPQGLFRLWLLFDD